MSKKTCMDTCCHGCPNLGCCSGECEKCRIRCPLSKGTVIHTFADAYYGKPSTSETLEVIFPSQG